MVAFGQFIKTAVICATLGYGLAALCLSGIIPGFTTISKPYSIIITSTTPDIVAPVHNICYWGPPVDYSVYGTMVVTNCRKWVIVGNTNVTAYLTSKGKDFNDFLDITAFYGERPCYVRNNIVDIYQLWRANTPGALNKEL